MANYKFCVPLKISAGSTTRIAGILVFQFHLVIDAYQLLLVANEKCSPKLTLVSSIAPSAEVVMLSLWC